MKNSGLLIFACCLCLVLVGCNSSWSQPIPEGEIIFQGEMWRPYELGFIQPDGQNPTIIQLDQMFAIPDWSSDGKFLFGLTGGISYDIGYPAYWDLGLGRFGKCDRNLPYFDQIQGTDNPENPYEVIVRHVWIIIRMDLKGCRRLETLIDYSEQPGEYEVQGFSYSPKTDDLLYGLVKLTDNSRSYHIIKRDLNSGEEVDLGQGINPSWSPDGTMIAYVGMDGLYVMRADGTQNRRLLGTQLFDPWRAGSPGDYAPFLHWSPDGEWLVYDSSYCGEEYCELEEIPIYIISVAGGAEQKVFVGGRYPNWRP